MASDADPPPSPTSMTQIHQEQIPQALPNATGDVFHLEPAAIDHALDLSRMSPRRRIILPLHRTQDARVQRMLNFLQPDTYITPHRHAADHAVESILLMRGGIDFLIFDDSGTPVQRIPLAAGEGNALVDIEPGVWHSFVVARPDTVLFETKKGPYSRAQDKEFAPWAPAEDEPGALDWLHRCNQRLSGGRHA